MRIKVLFVAKGNDTIQAVEVECEKYKNLSDNKIKIFDTAIDEKRNLRVEYSKDLIFSETIKEVVAT